MEDELRELFNQHMLIPSDYYGDSCLCDRAAGWENGGHAGHLALIVTAYLKGKENTSRSVHTDNSETRRLIESIENRWPLSRGDYIGDPPPAGTGLYLGSREGHVPD